MRLYKIYHNKIQKHNAYGEAIFYAVISCILFSTVSYVFMTFIIVRMLRPSISGLVSFSWSSTLLIFSTLAMMYLPSAEWPQRYDQSASVWLFKEVPLILVAADRLDVDKVLCNFFRISRLLVWLNQVTVRRFLLRSATSAFQNGSQSIYQ